MSKERLNRNQHPIAKRIIVRGILILDTPTCLGSGDADSPTDLALLRDSVSDCALLTGASIAGALRNYLREYEQGYGVEEQNSDRATTLFGGTRRDPDGEQSPLIINDAISTKLPVVEIRDGVKIDGATGTADDGAKYDLELLEAGTQFPLCFELLVEKETDESELKKALAIALRGLEKGEISLGMKKRRGFGRCKVEKWQVWEFDLRKDKDRIEWLKFDHWNRELSNKRKLFESIVVALGGISLKQQIDRRDRLFIHAKFKLASPLLIRSSQDLTKRSANDNNSKLSLPDVVHLRSQRQGKPKPIVSGTSLAGVLWHRAERIVNTLGKDLKIVYDLFGKVDEQTKEAKASRLVIDESVIESTDDLVQSRIAIDRFTGGAYHGVLFSEQPIFGIETAEEQKKSKKGKEKSKPTQKNKHIELKLELRQPKEYEIGLLLLLLKDLWTGDLPIGGTSSIGRGRFQGVEATLTWQQPEKIEQKWIISQNNGKLEFTGEDKQKLENFVSIFVEKTA
ncbi:RAMP superfamily CRISPR-associated protein [Limnofasciculus baicalensis]|uniref:RAMP superfamily CRISPR-associated protein n=1 Tax=Limnofasciculus baicalensis BBK-W-15 TaxID=2699891 RepID=A0AAE3GRG0_9CYAN|nr:RAMP superfamily CRISPR-associated protein [Limnofasciculus baicalensis]MCP2727177.1 RAMP superfamily CRISPR-associated protein [Limnofasciculus baicalensis BBK-W-15]